MLSGSLTTFFSTENKVFCAVLWIIITFSCYSALPMTLLKIILMIAYKIVIIKKTQEKLRNEGLDPLELCLRCKDSGPAFLPEIRSNERRGGWGFPWSHRDFTRLLLQAVSGWSDTFGNKLYLCGMNILNNTQSQFPDILQLTGFNRNPPLQKLHWI